MFVLLVDPCSAIDNKTVTSIFLGSNSQNIDLSQHTPAYQGSKDGNNVFAGYNKNERRDSMHLFH